MAFRPTVHLLEGELDNMTLGKVTGWMRFAGMKEKVIFHLEGNFLSDIRGAKIRFTGDGRPDNPEAVRDMSHFGQHQTGEVGDITAGLTPLKGVRGTPYIEWYSDHDACVIVLPKPEQLEIIGTPLAGWPT